MKQFIYPSHLEEVCTLIIPILQMMKLSPEFSNNPGCEPRPHDSRAPPTSHRAAGQLAKAGQLLPHALGSFPEASCICITTASGVWWCGPVG